MRRPSRTVSALNGVAAAALIAVVAAMALVLEPPAPPGIAEFAPRATKPVTKAPPGQSARSGSSSAGSCTTGQVCGRPVPTPSAAPSLSAPNRKPQSPRIQCYVWPDGSVTQTFDPQSPPCISGWASSTGNGGATTRGVTGTEIRVAVPGSAVLRPLYRDLGGFFSSRFEMYGRSLRLIPVDEPTSGAEGQRALANKVGKEIDAFASTGLVYAGTDVSTYVEQLARLKVVSADAQPRLLTSAQHERMSPYSWSYDVPFDVLSRNLAEFACKSLVGGNAAYAGPELQDTKRKFAVVLTAGAEPDTRILTDALAACGAPARLVVVRATPGPGYYSDPATNAQFVQLRRDGYTTLITFDDDWPDAPGQFATQAGYYPEWLIGGTGIQIRESQPGAGAASQMAHSFGMGTWNRLLPWGSEPWFRSAAEANPSVPLSNGSHYQWLNLYHSLLLLSSGIQMAGPDLTPESFEQALQSTEFANPGAGAAPSWQATVGFDTGHSMVRDLALVWWSPEAKDFHDNPAGTSGGGWCYVGDGKRWSVGTWPAKDPGLFDSDKGCQ